LIPVVLLIGGILTLVLYLEKRSPPYREYGYGKNAIGNKNVWPAPSARGLSRLAADPVCINVSGLEELPPAMMEIRTLRSS
jgi:hypothetical protein